MLEGLLEGLFAFLLIVTVAGVLIPLALCYLLVRQVLRTPTVRRVHAWLRPRHVHPTAGGTGARTTATGMGRRWAVLFNDALTARDRYLRTINEFTPGPLRDSLAAAAAEVDVAVAEAQRLAVLGSRSDLAHHEVVSALASQRRRRRSGGAAPPQVVVSLDAATRAQSESAERLAAATRVTLCQLQLVVARLHELSAHALELATVTGPPQVGAASSVADRLAALRAAAGEVEMASAL